MLSGGVLQLDEGAFGRYHELPAGAHCVSRSLRLVMSTFLIIIGSSLPYPSSPALRFLTGSKRVIERESDYIVHHSEGSVVSLERTNAPLEL